MTYAFSFDASTCTGCKACQVACKDKNNLPTGVLWRRVFEVSGGSWRRQGGAWTNDVFAYNFSMACNHCIHPKCAGVCPANAFTVREDGIVLLDGSKCMGCGYCAWACPYSVPQLDPLTGAMGKCDFCADQVDAGLPPACVAACPLRSLELVSGGNGGISGQMQLWELPGSEHPYPLPAFSRTQPRLAVKLHPAMSNGLAKALSNQEETSPICRAGKGRTGERISRWLQRLCCKDPAARQRFERAWSELPLLLFTLLAQAAAGLALCLVFLPPKPWQVILVGILLGLGGLFSFLHLGRKRNAWRAVLNLKKSWLSREVLAAGLFGASWCVSLLMFWRFGTRTWMPVTAALGLVMVGCMANIYRLRTQPWWNSWRTNMSFYLSAGILGLAISAAGIRHILVPTLLTALAALNLSATGTQKWWKRIIATGMLAGYFLWLLAPGLQPAIQGLMVGLSALGVVLGRWEFYASRVSAM